MKLLERSFSCREMSRSNA